MADDFTGSRQSQGVVYYDPTLRVNGFIYFSVGRILYILWENLGDHSPLAKGLIDECLSSQPTGLRLRNEYLLKIRTELQNWKTFDARDGFTVSPMASLCKILLSRVLDDSVLVDGVPKTNGIHPESLTIYTVVAVDPSKQNDQAVANHER